MKNKTDQKQIRYTLEDCLKHQRKLSNLVKTLIQENRCLSFNEKEELYNILPKAMLTQGASIPVSMVINKGWFTFSSLQNMFLRVADLTSNKIELHTSKPEEVTVTVEIHELWQFLYDKMLYYFPLACSEALHLSGENVPRTEQGEFMFSAKTKLDGGN
jgi:hypothetical protein